MAVTDGHVDAHTEACVLCYPHGLEGVCLVFRNAMMDGIGSITQT
jgi:hypothetical protein